MYNFFCTSATFSFPAAVVSRALDCGVHRGAACILHASLGPGRAPWRALWAFKVVASWLFSRDCFPPSRSQAGRWKPAQKNRTPGFRMFCAVYNSSHLAWLLGHLTLERGRLASWPSRTPSSRAIAVTLRAYFFVSRCICVCSMCSSMTNGNM